MPPANPTGLCVSNTATCLVPSCGSTDHPVFGSPSIAAATGYQTGEVRHLVYPIRKEGILACASGMPWQRAQSKSSSKSGPCYSSCSSHSCSAGLPVIHSQNLTRSLAANILIMISGAQVINFLIFGDSIHIPILRHDSALVTLLVSELLCTRPSS